MVRPFAEPSKRAVPALALVALLGPLSGCVTFVESDPNSPNAARTSVSGSAADSQDSDAYDAPTGDEENVELVQRAMTNLVAAQTLTYKETVTRGSDTRTTVLRGDVDGSPLEEVDTYGAHGNATFRWFGAQEYLKADAAYLADDPYGTTNAGKWTVADLAAGGVDMGARAPLQAVIDDMTDETGPLASFYDGTATLEKDTLDSRAMNVLKSTDGMIMWIDAASERIVKITGLEVEDEGISTLEFSGYDAEYTVEEPKGPSASSTRRYRASNRTPDRG